MSSSVCPKPCLRAIQSFSASTVKQSIQRLHMTGPKENPSQYLKPVVASEHAKTTHVSVPVRTFNTTRLLKRPHDTSTIDFAFLPHFSTLDVGTVSTLAVNVPILPDNYRTNAPAQFNQIKTNPIEDILPEIETVSMENPGQVAVMSENDGATHDGKEMEVFKMVEQVGRSVKQSIEREVGVMGEVWQSMLDDIVGGKKSA